MRCTYLQHGFLEESCVLSLAHFESDAKHSSEENCLVTATVCGMLQVPLPLADTVMGHLKEAVARGRGKQDWGVIAAVVREDSGQ